MRFLCCIACFILLLTFTSAAQSNNTKRNFPDRYQLDLPLEWNNPRLIEAVNDILTKTITELKDKQFCTGCSAGYIVRLVIDSPNIISTYNIPRGFDNKVAYFTKVNMYQFRSALGVFDTADHELVELLLIDAQETYSQNTDYSVNRPVTIKYSYSKIMQAIPVVGTVPVAEAPQAQNAGLKSLTLYDLMLKSEQRIFEIRSILKTRDQ